MLRRAVHRAAAARGMAVLNAACSLQHRPGVTFGVQAPISSVASGSSRCSDAWSRNSIPSLTQLHIVLAWMEQAKVRLQVRRLLSCGSFGRATNGSKFASLAMYSVLLWIAVAPSAGLGVA